VAHLATGLGCFPRAGRPFPAPGAATDEIEKARQAVRENGGAG
jgi:hypothetical protein